MQVVMEHPGPEGDLAVYHNWDDDGGDGKLDSEEYWSTHFGVDVWHARFPSSAGDLELIRANSQSQQGRKSASRRHDSSSKNSNKGRQPTVRQDGDDEKTVRQDGDDEKTVRQDGDDEKTGRQDGDGEETGQQDGDGEETGRQDGDDEDSAGGADKACYEHPVVQAVLSVLCVLAVSGGGYWAYLRLSGGAEGEERRPVSRARAARGVPATETQPLMGASSGRDD